MSLFARERNDPKSVPRSNILSNFIIIYTKVLFFIGKVTFCNLYFEFEIQKGNNISNQHLNRK